MSSIADDLERVRERIAAAAARSGRQPETVTLVAVTKGVELERIGEAIRAGVTNFGENRVQEALPKIAALATRHDLAGLRWHMVGHLQRNKVRQAVSLFAVIQSVDSERLAAEISRRARGGAHHSLDVLLQVNVAGEPQKFGVPPERAPAVLREIVGLPGLRAVGLMTIAPQVDRPEEVRPVFHRLRTLRDELAASGIVGEEFIHLSMGMSDDFEIAVEEGATIVRIGRAIFGPRPN